MSSREASSRARIAAAFPGARAELACGLLLTAVLVVVLHRCAWGVDDALFTSGGGLERFDPRAVAADRAYRRVLWITASALLVAPFVCACVVAATGRYWRGVADRARSGRPWLVGLAFGAGFGGCLVIFEFPFALTRFLWARQHGVLHQSIGGWSVDQVRYSLVVLVVVSAASSVTAVALVRCPRRWWLTLSGLLIPVCVALVVFAPLAVEPLFAHSVPLDDPRVQRDVASLARRASVPVGEVYVREVAARTRAANAAVSGVGRSRRITLDDTLLAGFSRRQVRVVIAHELGHVHDRHIVKGLAWLVVLIGPCAWVMGVVVRRCAGAPRASTGVNDTERLLRQLSAVAVCVTGLALAAVPLTNAISRSYERQADIRALEWTHDPVAFITTQMRLARLARADPDPPLWARVWFGTHPTPAQRIAGAQTWDTAHRGPS